MDKDIVQYLHYYLGCEARVRHRYVDYEPGTWTVWEKLTIDHYGRLLNDFSIDGIQLELRKLESMTEAGIKELFRLRPWAQPDTVSKTSFDHGLIQIEGTKDGEYFSDWQDIRTLYPAQFHYLLSRGFDLFGLIESGAAINKDKQ